MSPIRLMWSSTAAMVPGSICALIPPEAFVATYWRTPIILATRAGNAALRMEWPS